MDYRQLGRAGMRISALTLGTMTFGGRGMFAKTGSTDVAGARRLIDMSIAAGINLIDTANVYSQGLSEEILGEALGEKRERIFCGAVIDAEHDDRAHARPQHARIAQFRSVATHHAKACLAIGVERSRMVERVGVDRQPVDAAGKGARDVQLRPERQREAGRPAARHLVLVGVHVRLQRLEAAIAYLAPERAHAFAIVDDGLVVRLAVDAPRRAVRPVDHRAVAQLAAEQFVRRHAQRLCFRVDDGVLDRAERLADDAARARTRRVQQFVVQPLVRAERSPGDAMRVAAAIANYRRQRGESPTLVVVPDLLDYLRRGFTADESRGSWSAFDEMKQAPLLILDDLDTQTNIPWVRDKLFQLLNYRHTARLPTVITTAMSLDDLGDRLASRLVDHAVCSIIVLAEPQRDAAPAPARGRPKGRAPKR